jgi:large subunit ribosomal protein L6
MSNYIIQFPESLKKVSLKNSKIFFEGNLGIESVSYYPLSIKITDNKLEISKISLNNLFHARTIINLINQAIRGVDSGYKFQLKLIGLGYTCKLIDDKIEFKLGFSHLINKKIPSSLKVSCFNTKKRKQTIIVQGSNKQKVMEFVSLLQNLKYPEPYKGKGIFLKHQKIIRKQGKKV